MAISPHLANAWLDSVFNATSFSVTTLYMSIHTGATGTTGANEDTSTSRVAVTSDFAAAASSSVASNAKITVSSVAGGTYTDVGFHDALTGGNFLCGITLDSSQTLEAGGDFVIDSGDLTETLS